MNHRHVRLVLLTSKRDTVEEKERIAEQATCLLAGAAAVLSLRVIIPVEIIVRVAMLRSQKLLDGNVFEVMMQRDGEERRKEREEKRGKVVVLSGI